MARRHKMKYLDNFTDLCGTIKNFFRSSMGRETVLMGSALAMVIGYSAHHSIGWTLIDGCLAWFYVLWTVL